MSAGMRKFSIGETSLEQFEDRQIFGGDAIAPELGYRMSAMFWRLGEGESAPVPIPTDEVWIVTRGKVRLESGDTSLRAAAGEVLLVPRNLPGTAHVEAEAQLLTIAHPPSWQVEAEGKGPAGRTGDPAPGGAVRQAIEDLQAWTGIADGVSVGETVAAPTGFELRIAFLRLAAGTGGPLTTYVEAQECALACTKGALTVRDRNSELTLQAGEFACLPAGHAAECRADGASEGVLARVRAGDRMV